MEYGEGGFKSVPRPDRNLCIFTCRLITNPEFSIRKTSNSKKPVAYTRFKVVCNSSPINRKISTFFWMCAWGHLAEELTDRLEKGDDIQAFTQLVKFFTEPVIVRGEKVRDRMAMFEIKDFALRYKKTTEEDLKETPEEDT